MVNPMNPMTQPSDVGTRQTTETFRSQRIPLKDAPFLYVLIGFICILALCFGLSRIGSIERTREFSGELIRDGQSESGTLVLTHTLQDKVLGFNTLSGSIRIYNDSGKLVKEIPLADYTHTRSDYLSCYPSALPDAEIFLDTRLEQLAITTPTYTWISADPEFLDSIPYFPHK